MATTTYIQRGEALDYTNSTGSAIEAGDIVVIGDRVGVAGCDIADGSVGSIHVCGVFEMPKSSSNAIAMGKTVYFDGNGITEAADDGEQTPTAYPLVGYAAVASAASETKITVKLNG